MKGKRKGYSVFSRGETFAVAWTNGGGKRHTLSGIKSRAIAAEIGRAKATARDRVRGGVVTVVEDRLAEAGKLGVAKHVEAWTKAMKDKGVTQKHVKQSRMRVKRVLELAGIERLADLRPERIQSALAAVSDDSSGNTARHYLTSVKAFIKWCDETGRVAGPLRGVKRPAAAGERFIRLPVTAKQFAALLTATRTRSSHSPISGEERARFYEVLVATGFRVKEALSLTPESFHLDGEDPYVVVDAAYSKHRRRDEQLITADAAESLRPWLAGKTPGQPVFAFGSSARLNMIFRNDCAAAGIKAKKRSEGEVLGLHSLRRLAITSVGRAAGLAVAQTFARHSTPTLTRKYMDLTRHDLQQGLAGLPKVGIEKKPELKERTA